MGRRNNLRRKDRRVAAGSVSLPTGTVVFLFSDIEGSTRRWERYGQAMREALRRHDEILRSEIESRRGYIFKTMGDSFCAAFWTLGEALHAAVETQRRIGLENFEAIDGLHVRMAIHAGETDERGGDYFGPAVNRTARLLSAGHGGQILLSRVAADLAAERLPDGITLRHLGALPLRDLDTAEDVYQPVGTGLRGEFKGLRALATPPNNLPRQSTSFVGRRDDVARVEALVETGALVTIAGAGGIGKTRLALEVAASRLTGERDGVWLVDLSSITDASLISDAILSALSAPRVSDRAPLDALLEYLEKRELLLLLDNSEHLVAGVAAIAARIVAGCAHVSVLATSREPLDISGERLYRLATLEPASAAQLFVERARAANSAFRADAARPVIEAICERLDGIALAIELAAARVRTMSVESLASHLELRLLAGGRDRRPRQQTMRALIDWSYDLLTEEERRVLRSCAVFVRGFTLNVAAEVAAGNGAVDEGQMLGVLASLVDKSLVIAELQDGDQRYRMLEPIREYAEEKLAATGELTEGRRRHARALASLARAAYEEWVRAPRSDWLARTERDLANFRAALRWSVDEKNDWELGAALVADTTPIFLRQGLLAEGIEWCERILQDDLALPALVEARLRYGLSMLYSNIGANKKVLEQALTSADLYRQLGDVRGLARALSQVASRYALQSRYEGAKPIAEEALQFARNSRDRRLLADVVRRCAESFAGDGPDAVRARYEESVALFGALGRDDETARALHWWGQWEEGIGNYERAAELLQEATRLNESDLAIVMIHASEIASAYLALGDRVRAEPFARRALMLAARARHQVVVSLAIAYLAVVKSDSNARDAALLIGHALERFGVVGWELIPPDTTTLAELQNQLRSALDDAEFTRLLKKGAAWSEDEAVASALAL
jgi:predicted ATPase/class 3 adenylate cyclase